MRASATFQVLREWEHSLWALEPFVPVCPGDVGGPDDMGHSHPLPVPIPFEQGANPIVEHPTLELLFVAGLLPVDILAIGLEHLARVERPVT